MRTIKMISLDTSSTRSGWAFYENGELQESGVLDLKKEKDTEIRLEDMCLGIVDVLNRYKPSIVVIEMMVVTRNASTQRILSEIVGVVRGWALCNYAEFVRLRPAEWRKYARGEYGACPSGRDAAKKWSVEMVQHIYGMQVSDDQADAILIGRARILQIEHIGTRKAAT